MSPAIFSIIIGIVPLFIAVETNYLVKRSSLQSGFSGWQLLILGATIYALKVISSSFIMRHVTFSTLGVLYVITCVVFLILVGVTRFHERLLSGRRWQKACSLLRRWSSCRDSHEREYKKDPRDAGLFSDYCISSAGDRRGAGDPQAGGLR
jgi:hypothetical protein